MSRWLVRNLGLLVISLLLAFFFWAVATESENPTREAALNSSILLDTEGLEEGMIAYGHEDVRVRVRLRAPRSVWDDIRPEDVRAYLDLSNVISGTVTAPVRVAVRLRPVEVVSISPAEVTLTVEPFSGREVPVVVRTQGSPAIGYRSDPPAIAPQVVKVEGPLSMVERVVHAQVIVDIQGQQSEVRGDYQPVPVDQNEDPVPRVELAPRTVTVNVAIWQLGYIRDLAVTVILQGQPAPGYRIANLVVDPPIVKVSGRADIVRAAPSYLQTQPINQEGITQTLRTTVSLQMPEGLSMLDPPRPEVTVTLTVEVVRSGLTLDVRPEIRGLSPGLTATVGIDSVVVILSGPLSAMEQLDPEADVHLILDLTNLAPGNYTLTPTVAVPDRIVIENVIPDAVSVRIEASSTQQGSSP